MKLSAKIFSVINNRLVRNILFWVAMVYIVWNNDTQNKVYSSDVYMMGIAITTFILIAYTYTNNLWLMPLYMRPKKYKAYTWRAALLTLVTAAVFIFALKVLLMRYPLLRIHHISVFSTVVDTSRTAEQILYEINTCFWGLTVWLFLISTAWYMNDYSRQQKVLEAAQRKQVETELHFLKSQVNPHFLFNTLNNLYGLSLKKADTTPDAILRLSSILRYMLYESDAEQVSFEKEKEIMQAYINLELLRLPAGNDFRFVIESDREYMVPPLLWLPVLENVFKHATRVITDKYFIAYSAIIKDGVLTIHTRNNYKPNSNGTAEGGIGLSNLRKRLELLYPARHSIAAMPDGDAFVVELKVNL
ncbi:MAG TPA: histidine kinase [Flavipsychrobacter sp.]|nr:histidine kinase [Flavipsychrobacter sp.]